MVNKKTTFQQEWLQDTSFSSWIEKTGDITTAHCKLCMKTFSLSNMGRRALTSHMQSTKHKKFVATMHSSNLRDYVTTGNSAASGHTEKKDKEVLSVAVRTHTVNSNPNNFSGYLVRDDVTSAEILWCIQTVMSHSSLRSGSDNASLFCKMFPDSDIAKKMKLHRDKIGYTIVHGIAHYFRNELIKELTSEYLVFAFDESLNKVAQQQQFDVYIRYWNEEEREVKTRYFTSVFLGRSTSSELIKAFNKAMEQIDLKKILQISMDGPNVNFKFLRELKEELKHNMGDNYKDILDLGSCGLHTLHCAFKSAITETKWNVIPFFRALYNLFKDSPSRRALYTSMTNSRVFPTKFCAVRWLSNSAVAQRALDMLSNLKIFVEEVKKAKLNISSHSYKLITEFLKDPLLSAKLEFFKSLADDIEPFMKEFQGDAPLAPFLYNGIRMMIMNQMERFVKSTVLKEAKSVQAVDMGVNSLLPPKDVNLGIATNCVLKKLRDKVSQGQLSDFFYECRNCLIKFVSKLLERSPLKYRLTRALSCFDPQIATQGVSKKRLEALLVILHEAKWISSSAADAALREYAALTLQNEARLKEFSRSNQRVDHFWMEIFGNNQSVNIANVCKIVCTLSHGNASVERGFSINKFSLFENMTEEKLLISRRCIFDKITSIGGIKNLEIPKSLIHAARNASALYKEEINEKRKMKQEEDDCRKRKRVAEQMVKELIVKKAKILEQAKVETDAINEEIKILKDS